MQARTTHLALATLLVVLAAAGCSSEAPKPAGGNRPGAGSKASPKPAGGQADTTLFDVEVVDPQTAFAWGTDDEGFSGSAVLKTSDGGAHWAVVLRTEQTEIVGLGFVDAQNGTAISDGGVVYTTSDGGATWKASNDAGLFTARYSLAAPGTAPGAAQAYASVDGIAAAGGTSGWAFGERLENAPAQKQRIETVTRPILLHTADGGATWKEVKLGADVPPVGLKRGFFADPQNGWVVGGDVEEELTGVVLRTVDGGATWKVATPNREQVPEDVHFVDAKRGWVVTATEDDSGEAGPSEVYGTEDGGQTWRSLAKVPAPLRGVRFADAQNGWAVGVGGKIFHTADGGATWAEQSAQDWSGGQVVDITDPQYPKGGAAPTFTGFALAAPGRGWASGEQGVYEYKAK